MVHRHDSNLRMVNAVPINGDIGKPVTRKRVPEILVSFFIYTGRKEEILALLFPLIITGFFF